MRTLSALAIAAVVGGAASGGVVGAAAATSTTGADPTVTGTATDPAATPPATDGGSTTPTSTNPTSTDAAPVVPNMELPVPKPPPAPRQHRKPAPRKPPRPAAGVKHAASSPGSHGAAVPSAPLALGAGALAFNPSLSLVFPGTDSVMSFFVRVYRVPPFLLPIYVAAAERYGVPWQLLAAINEVETNYGQDVSVSSAGAEGWMQFLAPEWLAYGVDANAAGFRDPYNPGDAIFAAARYLAVAGAARDLRGAIYAYNHSTQYVDSVLLRARLIAGTPRSLTSSLTAIVDGRPPVAGAGVDAVRPIWVRGASTKDSHSMVGGASVTAPPGAAVLAVQNAEVVGSGYAPYRGRFIQLRDVLGDTYTYAGLGSVNSTYTLPGRKVRLVPLRRGAWVRAGTVLGKLRGRLPDKPAQFRFEIQPAGAGRVDPRPILDAWQLLGKALGSARPGAQPLFGPDARDALIGEIQLMTPLQLAQRLRSDPDVHISACGRRAIAAGRIDRRVLAVTEFLVASGASPTISLPVCGAGVAPVPATVAPRASGYAVDVSAIDGVSVRAHHAKGSLTDLVVRRLARLPAAMRPQRIVSPIGVPGTQRGLVVAGRADRIALEFAPTAQSAGAGPDGAAAANALSLDPTFDSAQWRNLIERLSQLPEPSVPSVATSAAVPDLPGSPAAGVESPFSLQLAPLTLPSPTASGAGTTPLGPGSSGSLFDAFAPLLGPIG